MNLSFPDAEPTPEPKPKKILIAGRDCGELKPYTPYTDCKETCWHAVVRLKDRRLPGGLQLFQGHGATPHEAVAAAVVAGREELAAITDLLAWLESQLGTTGLADVDVVGAVAPAERANASPAPAEGKVSDG